MKTRFLFAVVMIFSSLLFFSCEKEDSDMDENEYGNTDSTYLRVSDAIGGNAAGSCFSFAFPLTITLLDGSTESFTSGEEFLAFHEIWEEANPDGMEFPMITFPIDVILEDQSALTVPDEEVLDDLLDACEGEMEDDDDDEEDDEEEDDDDE